MNKNNVLITGFLPFLNNDTNPTEIIVKKLASLGYKTLIIDVNYESSVKSIKSYVDADKNIKFILSLGLANSRNKVSIEEYAYNEYNRKTPDNAGYIPKSKIIDSKFPSKKETRINAEDLVNRLNSLGYNCELSIDPGRYLCNYIYFNNLVNFNENSLFVHFPNFKSKEELDYGVKIVISIVEQLFN
jgi:pyroglutamyl-peptidase